MNVRLIEYLGQEAFLDDRAMTRHSTVKLTPANLGKVLYGAFRRWAATRWRLAHLRHARRVARWHQDRTRCGRRDDMLYTVTAMRGDRQPETGSPSGGPDLWIRWPGSLRTCDHCGSLHPHDLIQALLNGTAELNGTDKNYKVYVDVKSDNREDKYLKAYRQHFTPAQWKEMWTIAKERDLVDRWRLQYPQHYPEYARAHGIIV